MKLFVLPLLAFTGAALLACASDPATPSDLDAGTCAGNLDAFRFPHGGDGSADPFGAKAAGQARAGRIRNASQIVQPEDARNKVRVGDFVLANDRIALYIEAEGESDGYNPLGGEILALEPVGDDGRPTAVSYYNETLVMFARQTVKPEKVTVLADGSDGKAAIVRVSGKLENVPFLDTFKAIFPDEYGFPAAIDYVLEPGALRVQLRLSLVNTTIDPVDFKNKQFLGFFHAARSDIFTESQGYAEAKGESPWVAFDSGKAGFLVRAVGSTLRAELEVSGFQLFSLKGLTLDACATKTVDYVEMIAGAPGLDGVLEGKRAALAEAPWREVRGVVKEEGGAAIPGALVHVTAADGRYLVRTSADATGAFAVHVPPGDALLTPTAQGWAIPAATSVPTAATTIDLTLPRPGLLEVRVKDATTNEPIPARVQVIPSTAIAAAPPSYGLTDHEEIEGRLWQEFAIDGRALLKVPVGAHRVI
ncbi:MAG: hypothetical protein JWM74_4632, partial [Myxococcaceae bacterium]|nr:hypothetical protein [Myxococcaceae bacterium]